MAHQRFQLADGRVVTVDENNRVVNLQPLEQVVSFRDASPVAMRPAQRSEFIGRVRRGTKDDPDFGGDEKEQDSRIYYERSMLVSVGLAANAPGVQLLNPVQSAVNIGLLRVELIMTQALDTSLGLLYVDRNSAGVIGAANETYGLDVLTNVGASVTTPSSQGQAAVDWTSDPTLGTGWIRRQRMSQLGETTVWTWDPEGSNGPPLMIPPGASVVIAESNAAATGTFICNLRWQEERFGVKDRR